MAVSPVLPRDIRRATGRRRSARLVALLAALLAATAVNADKGEVLLDLINDYRDAPQRCDGRKARPVAPLLANRRLTGERITSERQLVRLFQRTGYEASRAQVIAVSDAPNPHAALEALQSEYCGALLSPRYSEVGVMRLGDTWQLVLAQPLQAETWSARPGRRDGQDWNDRNDREDREAWEERSARDDRGEWQEQEEQEAWDRGEPQLSDPPQEPRDRSAHQDWQAAGREVLQRVNAARAVARNCGSRRFAAAKALSWNVRLAQAAHAHSSDMAVQDFFSHTGRDGSQLSTRVERAGYAWGGLGENIAAGQASAQQAVAGWLLSPGHCANLMNPQFTEMGAAFARDASSAHGTYWTQVLGRPR